jgi:membrane associated rhomboid family serine protease
VLEGFQNDVLSFRSYEPVWYQFFSYQFLHAGWGHLLGNLLFLWVFGNGVNGKLGDVPYLLFYLAGGIFAVWGYASVESEPFQLIGASGAIAAVTTAYLTLFPRSKVTVLVWFFLFIHFFEIPAMLLIVVKIVIWDNVVSPGLNEAGNVAYGAHLSGCFFGFVAGLIMLSVRAVARDQFDILALWRRWYQRREFAAAMSDPAASARARFGSVARVEKLNPAQRAADERRFDQLAGLRGRIADAMAEGDVSLAAELYGQAVAVDPAQCLSERNQLAVARELYGSGRFPQAAAAFGRFLACYPQSLETSSIRLLLGIIYARDLQQYEAAEEHLTKSLESLRDDARRTQCNNWLQSVRAALGRPEPRAES